MFVSAGVFYMVGQIAAQYTGHYLRRADQQRQFAGQDRQFAAQSAEWEAVERRFQEGLAAARANLIVQIESARERGELEDLLRHWPLHESPLNILRASRRLQRPALNIFLCLIHAKEQELQGTGSDSLLGTLKDVAGFPFSVAERAAYAFEDDLRIYPEVLWGSSLRGDSLRTALTGMLWTEPTVLIELRVPDADVVEISTSHWSGPATIADLETMTDGSRRLFQRARPVRVQLAPRESAAQAEPGSRPGVVDARRSLLAQILAQVIVAAGDMFRATRIPDRISTPVFPSLMKHPTFELSEPALRKGPDGLDDDPESAWPKIVEQYIEVYRLIARTNPYTASETAARAATSCHELGLVPLADIFLDLARECHPAHSSAATDADFVDALRRFRPGEDPRGGGAATRSYLGQAFESIRGARAPDRSTKQTFERIARSVPSVPPKGTGL